MSERYSVLLRHSAWRELVVAQLAEPAGEFAFNVALGCAETVGVDAYPRARARLSYDGRSGYLWRWVVERTSDEAVADLIALAQRLLPLDEIACGPSTHAFRSGPGFAEDNVLEIVLSALRRAAPATGLLLIRAALNAHGIRLRRAALHVLLAWPAHTLPNEVHAWVCDAAHIEPVERVRAELTAFTTSSRTDGPGTDSP